MTATTQSSPVSVYVGCWGGKHPLLAIDAWYRTGIRRLAPVRLLSQVPPPAHWFEEERDDVPLHSHAPLLELAEQPPNCLAPRPPIDREHRGKARSPYSERVDRRAQGRSPANETESLESLRNPYAPCQQKTDSGEQSKAIYARSRIGIFHYQETSASD